jgi:hypothetical protein
MDDFPHRPTDHGDGTSPSAEPPTPEELAAAQACDDLLRRIEVAARQALDAPAYGPVGHDDALAALVREYAGCARAAGMRPDQMVRPLKVAMNRFFYDRRERADELFRLAILGYFDVAA